MLSPTIRRWIYANWQYAGLCSALFLCAILPLLWKSWNATLLILFLQLPLYLVHQVEEHVGDRFRLYINQQLAGGRDALTPPAVLVINLGGVWLLDLTALYLAYFVRPGLGLIAVYMALVNALVHVLGVILKRSYNPGAVTAVLLLLPGGLLGLWIFARGAQATRGDHILGLAVAIAVHVAIVGWLKLRLDALGPIPHTV